MKEILQLSKIDIYYVLHHEWNEKSLILFLMCNDRNLEIEKENGRLITTYYYPKEQEIL